MPDPAIPFATLVAYASGEMTPAEAAAFERRLTTTGLSTVATRLREIITTLRRDDSEAPTEAAVRRALAEFRPTPATATPMGTPLAALRRIVAELVFDSRRQTTLAGFRGGVAAYQLGFESTLGRVGVQISETKARDAGWRLRGQVLGEERPSRVALVSQVDDTVVADATPDETGQFTMDAATGSYELLVEFVESDCVIVMPEVELS